MFNTKYILDKGIDPVVQLGLTLILCLIINMLIWIIGQSGIVDFSIDVSWRIILTLMLFFAFFNSLLAMRAKEGSHYYMKSIIGFVLLSLIGGLIAYGFSGLSIDEAGSIKWIYFVFTFGFLVFVSIVQMMIFLVAASKRYDEKWNNTK